MQKINPNNKAPNSNIFKKPNSFIAHAPITSEAVQATTNNAKEYAIGIDCVIFDLKNINGPTIASINAAINPVNARALHARFSSCIKYEPISKQIVETSINTVKCLIADNAGLAKIPNTNNGNIMAIMNNDSNFVNANA